jgi:DNA-binding PadR family transcriptional regulator
MMADSDRQANDMATAHARFFAEHGFADVGAHHRAQHDPQAPLGRHGFRSFGRAKHGSVRAMVLLALVEEPGHGYQIMQWLEEQSDGFWKLSPGSVYPALQLLEDQGLVTSERIGGRRVYTLTDDGRQEASALKSTHGAKPWLAARNAGEQRFRLWQAISELGTRTRAVAVAGTPQQAELTLTILARANADIEALGMPSAKDGTEVKAEAARQK